MIQGVKGIDFLLDFWDEKYLKEYVKDGGSKIKFVTGKYGSGKTYFLKRFAERAKEDGYLAIELDATEVPFYDFRNIYLEILKCTDLEGCLKSCADNIIRQMNYDPERIQENRSFSDYLASRNEANIINKAAIRDGLKNMFLDNPYLERGFSQCCALLCADILGYPSLDSASKSMILRWMKGDKEIKLSMIKALGISANPINRSNARHLLRSLCEIVSMAGYTGLLINVDNLDYIQEKYGEDIKYTRMRRDDTYEIIRQLIDDIDSLRHIMFVFAFDQDLINNEKYGFKSYQALWMRIQNEIRSQRFNRFVDIANLDELAKQEYDKEYLKQMVSSFIEEARNKGEMYRYIEDEELNDIKANASYATIGLPLYIKEKVLEKENGHE